jgi:hypothetical protein
VAGISVTGYVLRQCVGAGVRALMERCRRRTITETAAALASGGVMIQSTADGNTLMVARPKLLHPTEPPPVEHTPSTGHRDGAVIDGQVVGTEPTAEVGR